jgi:hypothetical protein
MAAPPYNYPQRRSSSRTTIAGILLILAAIFGIVMAVGFIFISSIYDEGGYLEPDGVIEGEVVLPGNETDASNILVLLESVHRDESDYTDSDGLFRFTDLEIGKYTVVINHSGYKTHYYEVNIEGPGEVKEITIELQEGQGEVREEAEGQESMWNQNLFLVCGVMTIVFSLITFMGGVFAIKQTNYWLALLGSVTGIFAIGVGLGFIFSLIALIMLLLARNDFKHDEQ